MIIGIMSAWIALNVLAVVLFAIADQHDWFGRVPLSTYDWAEAKIGGRIDVYVILMIIGCVFFGPMIVLIGSALLARSFFAKGRQEVVRPIT